MPIVVRNKEEAKTPKAGSTRAKKSVPKKPSTRGKAKANSISNRDLDLMKKSMMGMKKGGKVKPKAKTKMMYGSKVKKRK